MEDRPRALLQQIEAALLGDDLDPAVVLPGLDLFLKAALRGKLLDPGTRARVTEGLMVDRLIELGKRKRLSDREMAREIGIHVRTFRRWVEGDPEILSAGYEDPRPHKDPVRKWRPWEVQARWAVRPMKRRGT